MNDSDRLLARPILPIDPCSRNIVRHMKSLGYRLQYREFDGEHGIPPALAGEAVAWFTMKEE